MKPGDAFNPRFESCGFHPGEIISRRRDLTDGQKLLYDRLVRWARVRNGGRPNERTGEVWRSHENMAAELGKSAKQIGRDLAALESRGLIKHRIRDGRRSNTYFFLFHSSFEWTSASSQIPLESDLEPSPVSVQSDPAEPECPLATGHPRPVNPDLSRHQCPTNQKVFNQKGESSSSSQANGRLREQQAQSEPEKTTKKHPLEPQGQSLSAAPWWTAADLQKAAEVLTGATEASFYLRSVDVATVMAIMPNIESIPDLRLWLASSKGILGSAKTWGRYVVDAKHWPARRAATLEQVRRSIDAMPTCPHGVKPANRCGTCAEERERTQQAQQLAAEQARKPRPLTPEEIAARAERLRETERLESVNERWLVFYERQLDSMKRKLNQGVMEAFRNGGSFFGETLDEREGVLDCLENGTHSIFKIKVA